MTSTTLIYIVLAVLISSIVAFAQYFYKVKKAPKLHIFLFSLKAISLFLLMLLFINPKINTIETENNKPVLSVLVDNSLSTKSFKEENNVKTILNKIENNQGLQDKFDVQTFSFGKDVKPLDSLTFSEKETNIFRAIEAVDELQKDKMNATVLISDGNQTKGNDYRFLNSKNKVHPVLIGDTTRYQDVQITQLNVNKYSYIKNKFPVEALVHYQGNETIKPTFTITHKGKNVFSKKVVLSPKNPTQTITTNLVSDEKGIQYYAAAISNIKNEKNTKNNYKNFSVEVIDERTKVLVLSSFLHPDLGAIKKAIESNKQREVAIALIGDKNINFSKYQFFVLYQPTSRFKNVFNSVKSNYLIVSGTKTDWSFINSLNIGVEKKVINQPEDYTAIYNDSFLTFMQDDIGFEDFAPLKDKFGEVQVNKESQSLLFQKFAGVTTKQPLLLTLENNADKYSVLLGEGIWKWRAASFLKTQSFKQFDAFLGNLVQYLTSNKKRKRLEVYSESIYTANTPIRIAAFYVDKNFVFDNRASLELKLTNNTTKEQKVIPFSLVNNSYQVSVEDLSSGSYSYQVSVKNQTIKSFGKFIITDYEIEEQFTNSDFKKMNSLALKTNGTLFYPNKIDDLITKLTKDNSYYTTQKSITKKQNLIDWKWILFLVITLLSLEWFIRKYYGKI